MADKPVTSVVIRPFSSEERYMQLRSTWKTTTGRIYSPNTSSSSFKFDDVIDFSHRSTRHEAFEKIAAKAKEIATESLQSSIHCAMSFGCLNGGSSYTMWGHHDEGLVHEVARCIRDADPEASFCGSLLHITGEGVRDATAIDNPTRMTKVPASFEECGLVINGVARHPIATADDLHALLSLRMPLWLTDSGIKTVFSGDESTVFVLYVTQNKGQETFVRSIVFVDAGSTLRIDDSTKSVPDSDANAMCLIYRVLQLARTADATEASRTLLSTHRFLPRLLRPFMFGQGGIHIFACISPAIQREGESAQALRLAEAWRQMPRGTTSQLLQPEPLSETPEAALISLLTKRQRSLVDELSALQQDIDLTDDRLYVRRQDIEHLQGVITACSRVTQLFNSRQNASPGGNLKSVVHQTRAALARSHIHKSVGRPCLRVLHPNPSVTAFYYIHLSEKVYLDSTGKRRLIIGANKPTDPQNARRRAPMMTPSPTPFKRTLSSPVFEETNEKEPGSNVVSLAGMGVVQDHLVVIYGEETDGPGFYAVSPGSSGEILINGLPATIAQTITDNDRVMIGDIALEALLSDRGRPKVSWAVCSIESRMAQGVAVTDLAGQPYWPVTTHFRTANQWLGASDCASKIYDYLREIRSKNCRHYVSSVNLITQCITAVYAGVMANVQTDPHFPFTLVSRPLLMSDGREAVDYLYLQRTPFQTFQLLNLTAVRSIGMYGQPSPDPVQTVSKRGLIGVAAMTIRAPFDHTEFSLAIRRPAGWDQGGRPLGRLKVLFKAVEPEGLIRHQYRDTDIVDEGGYMSDDGFDSRYQRRLDAGFLPGVRNL
ncbi:Kinesin motor domain [Carpediemonas membranifera]|uniref:Kinesin motor domain n=1 Tax=Carpediemonas membranifera TaxID=201153 RepID=A0A8J6E463_9EUKA|nr:Kinesin motor domain [Carpediemonas membranifera]|eukprot:KAG9396818.1 Kinesin motor domain [Carpediemonas membranifera]